MMSVRMSQAQLAKRCGVERDGAALFLALKCGRGDGAIAGGVLQREQAGGKAGKRLQLLELGGRRKGMRLAVEHAECADAGAGHHHRRAGVEADMDACR